MMLKTIREHLQEMFHRAPIPKVTEDSTVQELLHHYPGILQFLERRYGIKDEPTIRHSSLKALTHHFGLPPAQIIFMEVQMQQRFSGVETLSAIEAKKLMESDPDLVILDVREEWEAKICRIEKSELLTPECLDKLLSDDFSKSTALLLYCHFGVRSLDAALFLKDRGFSRVYSLQGGIDAWSTQVDSNVKRYDAAYC